MNTREFLNFLEENRHNFKCHAPCPEKVIKEAEKTLNTTFPQYYVEMLKLFNIHMINNFELYGIPQPDDILVEGVPNMVWLTLQLREWENIPMHVLNLGIDGLGANYAFDLETGIIYYLEPGLTMEECEIAYPSLIHFFRDQLNA
jgi:hypothetical protein